MFTRKSVAIGIILVSVLGLGFAGVLLNPGIFAHGLVASAEASYWQDFMPSIPEEGPPFYMIVYVNVTNTGSTTVTNFDVPQVTVYFSNNTPLITLSLHQVVSDWSEIGPGESFLIQLTNDRDTIFSPTIEEGALLYSKVLMRWGIGSEMILTTPPSELYYTH